VAATGNREALATVAAPRRVFHAFRLLNTRRSGLDLPPRPISLVSHVTACGQSVEEFGDERMVDRTVVAIEFEIRLGDISRCSAAIDQEVVPRLTRIGLRAVRFVPRWVGVAFGVDRHDDAPIAVSQVTNELPCLELWPSTSESKHERKPRVTRRRRTDQPLRLHHFLHGWGRAPAEFYPIEEVTVTVRGQKKVTTNPANNRRGGPSPDQAWSGRRSVEGGLSLPRIS